MYLKSTVICLYLVLMYFISQHFPIGKLLFYPTLAAFSFFFMSRKLSKREVQNIFLATVLSSFFGELMYYVDGGILSFFVTCLGNMAMLLYFKINAAPITAISIIPFVYQPAELGTFSLSVLLSMTGLFITLQVAEKIEQFMTSRRSLETDSVKKTA